MYIAVVALFLFILPAVSVLVELFLFRSQIGVLSLVGTWLVFWAVGVRLGTAGIRQIFQPGFTANDIFGIKGSDSNVIVQELGFANLSIGVLGVWSLFRPGWMLPAALVGSLFYGLAGIRHLFNPHRNLTENVATYSDLLVFLALMIVFVLMVRGG